MEKISFQDMILRLQQYWAAQGCVILQPFDMEVGAGTFHPGTFLRAIGPEPWRAMFRPTLPTTHRRPLWRQSQSRATLLSIASDAETFTG